MRTGGRRAIDSQGASLAKAIGSLFLLGAGFAAITVALPHPSGGNVAGQLAIGGAMLLTGVTCWILAGRFPARLAHGLLIVAAAGAGGLIVAAGVAAGGYGSIFVWVVLVRSQVATSQMPDDRLAIAAQPIGSSSFMPLQDTSAPSSDEPRRRSPPIGRGECHPFQAAGASTPKPCSCSTRR